MCWVVGGAGIILIRIDFAVVAPNINNQATSRRH